jgi:hypothetical protein
MKSRGKKTVFNFGKLISPKSHKRNLDTIKLLVGRRDFQEIVKAARKRLKIAADGLTNTEDLSDRWIDEADKILSSADFAAQEKRISNSLNNGEIPRRMANKQLALLYDKLPLNHLKNQAAFIIDKFHLPSHFQRHIEGYIASGDVSAPTNNFSGGQLPANKRPSEVRYIPINIYARLAPDELKALKQYVDWLGKSKLPQYHPLKNIDTDLTIEKWFETKNFDPEASSPTDMADEYFGDRKKTSKLRDRRRNLKELRDRRFGAWEK